MNYHHQRWWLLKPSEVISYLLFYVLAALAGLWRARRGAWVGALLGALSLASHFLSGLGTPPQEDVIQAMTFVVVGLTAGFLREQALRSKKSLQETQDYLNSLIRRAYAPSIVWDSTLRITRFDAALERLTGYTADEVIGQELHMLFPEASQDESLSKIICTLSGEHSKSVKIPIRRKDQ